ncbi:MAG: hypothetical protein EOO73_21290 [Myxococcales bacterium]|nr:MAG: hypothetical protein EOO73_21290 [Myxococcales bacterium]
MLSVGSKRALCGVVLGLSLTLGCAGRWQPANSHDVAFQAEPQAAYATVLEVATAKGYTVDSKDEAAKKVRLQSRVSSKSFIDVEVAPGLVKLAPAGNLVRGDKVHKTLNNEVNNLEADLKQRFGGGQVVAVAPTASGSVVGPGPAPAPVADGGAMPAAWTEPAYDPSVWGNGQFTCLPVRVPADHQGALTLQLSNGEKADLQLSLAYDAGLCRSPAQCKQSSGCPALGIGDAERVNRLAGRLSRGEVASQALLLDAGKPIANIDLSRHGSIVQAMSEIKR